MKYGIDDPYAGVASEGLMAEMEPKIWEEGANLSFNAFVRQVEGVVVTPAEQRARELREVVMRLLMTAEERKQMAEHGKVIEEMRRAAMTPAQRLEENRRESWRRFLKALGQRPRRHFNRSRGS